MATPGGAPSAKTISAEATFNSAEGVAIFDWWKKMVDEGILANYGRKTVDTRNAFIAGQTAMFIDSTAVPVVRYRNPLMENDDPDRHQDNVIEMRWILQRELGSNLVFFHEVIIPPGKVEGTHRHIGSEELYHIVEGEGIAYMGEHDDPTLAAFPVVERSIFGIGKKRVRELPVRPGVGMAPTLPVMSQLSVCVISSSRTPATMSSVAAGSVTACQVPPSIQTQPFMS